MNIQSLSIVVPTNGCINNCKFCVSKMHKTEFENNIDPIQIKKRIKFAVNNGVNTCIITGTGEALQNKTFLWTLMQIFKEMDHPFPNIELQTSGVLLNEENLNFLNDLGVNTISLSVSNLLNDEENMKIMGVPKTLQFSLYTLTHSLKNKGFNVRLSLNMINNYASLQPEFILKECKEIGADQITFRKIYFPETKNASEEINWIWDNAKEMDKGEHLNKIKEYIKDKGSPLYNLPYGPTVYSINGMSVVMDDDCMSKENKDTLKYVIIRENGKLYCRWDDEGSLIF